MVNPSNCEREIAKIKYSDLKNIFIYQYFPYTYMILAYKGIYFFNPSTVFFKSRTSSLVVASWLRRNVTRLIRMANISTHPTHGFKKLIYSNSGILYITFGLLIR